MSIVAHTAIAPTGSAERMCWGLSMRCRGTAAHPPRRAFP
jgi:hypothetical protein